MGADSKEVRVLIVDDLERVRESLRSVLSLDGDVGVVGEAKDGREAVELVGCLSPDVVLMDLEMPVVDGYAASETIKRLERAPAVVALTIHGDRSSRERASRAGVDAFVEKGASVRELLRVIHGATGGQEGRAVTFATVVADYSALSHDRKVDADG